MNRREFLKMSAGGVAFAAAGCATDSKSREITKRMFAGLEELPPVMPNAVVKDGALKGKCVVKYVDDCIWFLRDIAKDRPKSIFDNAYLGGFKRIHDATGLKVQFNLFYRNDFFYGMHPFTLKNMPADYRSEFQANADWIKFGFHSLQEFPDYPWINSDYEDVAMCLRMIRGEIARFAGDNLFARYLLPHWVPMSKDGVRALVDNGIRMMAPTAGSRYAYNGDPESLPYGHSFRLENNRKPETALYTRVSNNTAISASICGYNHLSEAQKDAVIGANRYVYDPDTKMRFRSCCTAPMSCLNLQKIEDVPADIVAVRDCDCIGYGNHEQYFYRDYLIYQPDYMEKEMLVARTMKEMGRKFAFMEEMV